LIFDDIRSGREFYEEKENRSSAAKKERGEISLFALSNIKIISYNKNIKKGQQRIN